ncbi:hypothetical protein Aoki45_11250 [Algoriphagus sp. oki45]|uniref:hypothetical protein n=1 Tax=Algoriphagus sp. oki45 TaxID=3067294 RepID=UPI0027F288FF|nr:hypothetical protein Aoki45_11250 [Algoriphagus sp. oki45]
MNKIKSQLLALVEATFLLFLTSCATNHVLSNFQQEYSTPLNLDYLVLETQVIDLRNNISNGEMKIPILSSPNQLIRHTPILTNNHHQLIANTIMENTTGNGVQLKVKVNILESYKEFSSTWSTEKEKGFARIQIDFLDPISGRFIGSSNATGEIFFESIDSTPQRMEEVYQLSLKAATRMGLESIQKMVNNPGTTN